MHTTHSDGEKTPLEILEIAEKSSASIISITDHNNYDAYSDLNKIDCNKYFSGKIINGVEINCIYNSVPIEVLIYNFDMKKFKKYLDKWNNIYNLENTQKVMDTLIVLAKKNGLKTNDNIKAKKTGHYSYPFFCENIKTFPENKKFFKDEIWNSVLLFYRKCICNQKSLFHVDLGFMFPNVKEVVDAAHECGGIVSVAHCHLYVYKNVYKTLKNMYIDSNFDCIECYYPTFTKHQVKKTVRLCKKLNVGITGGSDYHGSKRKNQIVTGIDNNLCIKKSDLEFFFRLINNKIT